MTLSIENQPWPKLLHDLIGNYADVVMVTIVDVLGSSPREKFCTMFILKQSIVNTIGGGQLEYTAIKIAREMLANQDDNYRLQDYGLGVHLQQCCGGRVVLAFEKFNNIPDWLETPISNREVKGITSSYYSDHCQRELVFDSPLHQTLSDSNLEKVSSAMLYQQILWFDNPKTNFVIFGAGHVAQALISIVCELPLHIHWLDQRRYLFNKNSSDNLTIYDEKPPTDYIEQLPENSIIMVMTHSHQLDEDICFKLLMLTNYSFLGLIGSKTKKARILHRLKNRGICETSLKDIVCPIGVSGIKGKSPKEIAIAVAAQVLMVKSRISV